MEKPNGISARMRKYRMDNLFSMEKCASAAGVSTNTWCSIENGARKPLGLTVEKIERVIGREADCDGTS